MKGFWVSALVGLSGSAGLAFAQPLEVNLAKLTAGTPDTVTVSPGRDRVVIVKNRIPGKAYTVTVRERPIPIPALSLTPFKADKDRDTDCDALDGALKKLNGATEEASVPDLVDQVAKMKAKIKPDACSELVADAERQIKATRSELDERFSIVAGIELVVTVERDQNGKSLKWEKVFSGGPRGEWLISYGFTFLPDDDERWFSKATDNPKEFAITEKAERQKFDFAPSVFFTWLPTSQANRNFNYGPTAGLGFDLSTPVVFLGGSVGWNQNIAFVGGLVAHQVERLSGEYNPNQIIGENLSSDKLVERTYAATYFLGLSFRFGSSPFKSTEPKAKKPDTP
jgi:hypothetical protein